MRGEDPGGRRRFHHAQGEEARPLHVLQAAPGLHLRCGGPRGGGVHLRIRPARPQVQPGLLGGVLVLAVGLPDIALMRDAL